MRLRIRLLCLLLLAPCLTRAEDFQGSTHLLPYDEPPHHYSTTTPRDPIAQLQTHLTDPSTSLPYHERFGWLPALLETLQIPASSQTLVFSKTSLQRHDISPHNPRALYFSDDLYLGYIPGAALMEISAVDPQLGAVFYSVEQRPGRTPTFTRETDCLRCHASPRTLGVPGHLLRSLATDHTGEMILQSEFTLADQTVPFAERWGGWYVTGQHGRMGHRGNLVGAKAFDHFETAPLARGNLTDLGDSFDRQKYLQPGSDLVALLVLQHQAKMHNYLTRLRYETVHMLTAYGHLRYLRNQVDAFLRYLLFTEESPLTSPVSGDPAYIRAFTALGPRDPAGRSLRDFDLQTRLFRYPCSFLIYSPAFDALPPPMREHLLQRLHDILTGQDTSPAFAQLPAERRQTILEILRATKPNLPAYWHRS